MLGTRWWEFQDQGINYVTDNLRGELKITLSEVILLLLFSHVVFISRSLIHFYAEYFIILFLKSQLDKNFLHSKFKVLQLCCNW